MKNKLMFGALVCALGTILLAACDSGTSNSQVSTVATVPPTQSQSQVTVVPTTGMAGMKTGKTPVAYNIPDDVAYIDLMIPHHQLAVDMAQIALDRATHPELKGLASDIIKEQKDEISRMGAWRMSIAGSATPGATMSGMQMPGMDVDLAKLKISTNFDHDFIAAMIPHHQSAIDMSKAALASLKNSGLHDMAQDVITTQQVEIDRMKGWLAAWH